MDATAWVRGTNGKEDCQHEDTGRRGEGSTRCGTGDDGERTLVFARLQRLQATGPRLFKLVAGKEPPAIVTRPTGAGFGPPSTGCGGRCCMVAKNRIKLRVG